MYTIKRTGQFKKDLKTAIRRGYNLKLMEEVVDCLAAGGILDEKYRDHGLSGNWAGYRECHILPDWLLIYQYDNADLILYLTRTGTHSDLFG